MKYIYTLALLLTVAISAQAQSLEASPNPNILSGAADEFNYKAIINVKNVSGNTLNLLWRRDVSDIPAEWANLICDANLCYPPSTNECPENKPSTIAPGDSADFFIEIRPNGKGSDASVMLDLFDQSATGDVLITLEGRFELMNTSTENGILRQQVLIYPNPVIEDMNIQIDEQIGKVVIVDATGKVVRSVSSPQNGRVSLQGLKKGTYFAQLFDTDGVHISTNTVQFK